MAPKVDGLTVRDQSVFSKLTKEQWRSYAGKVLAIDPSTDKILASGRTEKEVEAKLKPNVGLVEFFHVPAERSMSAPGSQR